jgi:hypothetical protein
VARLRTGVPKGSRGSRGSKRFVLLGSGFPIIAAVIAVSGCSFLAGPLTELQRVTSPDGRVDAVVAERATGATVATPTLLFLGPKGARLEDMAERIAADHAGGASVRWIEDRFLEFSFNTARIYRFTNFWYFQNDAEYVVEIKLRPLKEGRVLD